MIHSFDERVIDDALRNAPPAVKEMIDSEDVLPEFVGGLGRRNQLHVDVIGSIAQLLRDTLLGLRTPADFYSELLALKISDQVARRIMEELNTNIVIPLRDKTRKGSPSAPAPRPSLPTPNYVPVQPTVSPPPALIQSTAPAAKAVPLPPKIVMPPGGPRPSITIPAPVLEASRLSVLNQQRPLPAPLPNLPGAMPPVATPSTPRAQIPPPAPRVPGTPDPYREPVE